MSPGLEAAQAGLAEAERIGRPGFGFADGLAGGGRGPSMVLLHERLAMSRTELSVADFLAYWQAAGAARFGASLPACRDREKGFLSSAFSRRSWQAPDVPTGERYPVVCVSYPMAEAYAAWLSDQAGARYRLPTGAEWHAARGRGQPGCGAANRRDASYRASFGGREGGSCDDGYPALAPVASFAARGAGLYDLDGNVREWVAECAADCRERRALGGAWLIDGDGGEAFDADKGYNSIGVRLVREWTGEPRAVPLDGTP
jgi:formylglycine-generating enzyme required for sulfatase activity